MKTAVLSGKGGAGKTMAAVNLAASLGCAVYVDCDVEEPNGHIFLKPEGEQQETVCVKVPTFDSDRCVGCRKCVDHCRFHALVFIKGKPMFFPEVCHGCGLCSLVCREGAVQEAERPIGVLKTGRSGNLTVVTGVLNEGEVSGVPLIEAALRSAKGEDVIIDGPPGSACNVMECVKGADVCLIVAEPTAFGLHNFLMVAELCRVLHKPHAVLLNKVTEPYEPMEEALRTLNIPVLGRLPYDATWARSLSDGQLLAAEDETVRALFRSIYDRLKEVAG